MDSTDLGAVNLWEKQTWRREDPEQKRMRPQKNTLESEMMRGKMWIWYIGVFKFKWYLAAAAAAAPPAKLRQSCPTLCNPVDSSLPGSPVPGILQARVLERVAIAFSEYKVQVTYKTYIFKLYMYAHLYIQKCTSHNIIAICALFCA